MYLFRVKHLWLYFLLVPSLQCGVGDTEEDASVPVAAHNHNAEQQQRLENRASEPLITTSLDDMAMRNPSHRSYGLGRGSYAYGRYPSTLDYRGGYRDRWPLHPEHDFNRRGGSARNRSANDMDIDPARVVRLLSMPGGGKPFVGTFDRLSFEDVAQRQSRAQFLRSDAWVPASLQPCWKKLKPFLTVGFCMAASGFIATELVISKAWDEGGICTQGVGEGSNYQKGLLNRLGGFLRQYMASQVTPSGGTFPFSRPSSSVPPDPTQLSDAPSDASSLYLEDVAAFQGIKGDLEVKVFRLWPHCDGAYVARLWQQKWLTHACIQDDSAGLLGSEEPLNAFDESPALHLFACTEDNGWVETVKHVFGYGITHVVGQGASQVLEGLDTFAPGLGQATREAFSDIFKEATNFVLMACVAGGCQQSLPGLLSAISEDTCQGFRLRDGAVKPGFVLNATLRGNMSEVWESL